MDVIVVKRGPGCCIRGNDCHVESTRIVEGFAEENFRGERARGLDDIRERGISVESGELVKGSQQEIAYPVVMLKLNRD